jgi:NADH:ubiquinone oxidoreductase subunit 4 (subunit M)
MNAREFLALAPLAVLCLWLGVQPSSLIDMIEPDIKPVVAVIDKFRTNEPTEAIASTTAESSPDELQTVTTATP